MAHHQTVLATETEHDVHEGIAIDRLFAARAVQKRRCTQTINHVVRVRFVDRANAKGDILQDLDENAAEADHHHRAELGITIGADDELATGRDHLLDKPSFDIGGADRGPLRHRRNGIRHGGNVCKVQHDATGIRFVQDVGRDDLAGKWRVHSSAFVFY